MKHETKKLLIFDVDGVLEDETIIGKERHNALISAISARFGLSKEEAEKKYKTAALKPPAEKRTTSCYIFMTAGFTRQEYFKVLNAVDPLGVVKPHKNANKTLKKLSKNNTIVAYSNSPLEPTTNALKILNLHKYIKKVYSSEQFKESKPSIKNLKAILKEQGFKAKDAVFIGNSLEKDLRPAKKLKMTTILYDPKRQHKDGLQKGADYVVGDLKTVGKML